MEEAACETSLIRERYFFYARCQDRTESFYDFLNDVCRLAKTCKFNGLEESLIRDRIIFGVHDMELRNKFLKEGGDPSLKEVVEICRSATELDDDIEYENPVIEKLEIERDYIGVVGLRLFHEDRLNNGTAEIGLADQLDQINESDQVVNDEGESGVGVNDNENEIDDSDDESNDDSDDDSDDDSNNDSDTSMSTDCTTNDYMSVQGGDIGDMSDNESSSQDSMSLVNITSIVKVVNSSKRETDKLENSLGSIGSLNEITNCTDSFDFKSLDNIVNIHSISEMELNEATELFSQPTDSLSIDRVNDIVHDSNVGAVKKVIADLTDQNSTVSSDVESDSNENNDSEHVSGGRSGDDEGTDNEHFTEFHDNSDISAQSNKYDNKVIIHSNYKLVGNPIELRSTGQQIVQDVMSIGGNNNNQIINKKATFCIKNKNAMETVSNLRSILDDLAKITIPLRRQDHLVEDAPVSPMDNSQMDSHISDISEPSRAQAIPNTTNTTKIPLISPDTSTSETNVSMEGNMVKAMPSKDEIDTIPIESITATKVTQENYPIVEENSPNMLEQSHIVPPTPLLQPLNYIERAPLANAIHKAIPIRGIFQSNGVPRIIPNLVLLVTPIKAPPNHTGNQEVTETKNVDSSQSARPSRVAHPNIMNDDAEHEISLSAGQMEPLVAHRDVSLGNIEADVIHESISIGNSQPTDLHDDISMEAVVSHDDISMHSTVTHDGMSLEPNITHETISVDSTDYSVSQEVTSFEVSVHKPHSIEDMSPFRHAPYRDMPNIDSPEPSTIMNMPADSSDAATVSSTNAAIDIMDETIAITNEDITVTNEFISVQDITHANESQPSSPDKDSNALDLASIDITDSHTTSAAKLDTKSANAKADDLISTNDSEICDDMTNSNATHTIATDTYIFEEQADEVAINLNIVDTDMSDVESIIDGMAGSHLPDNNLVDTDKVGAETKQTDSTGKNDLDQTEAQDLTTLNSTNPFANIANIIPTKCELETDTNETHFLNASTDEVFANEQNKCEKNYVLTYASTSSDELTSDSASSNSEQFSSSDLLEIVVVRNDSMQIEQQQCEEDRLQEPINRKTTNELFIIQNEVDKEDMHRESTEKQSIDEKPIHQMPIDREVNHHENNEAQPICQQMIFQINLQELAVQNAAIERPLHSEPEISISVNSVIDGKSVIDYHSEVEESVFNLSNDLPADELVDSAIPKPTANQKMMPKRQTRHTRSTVSNVKLEDFPGVKPVVVAVEKLNLIQISKKTGIYVHNPEILQRSNRSARKANMVVNSNLNEKVNYSNLLKVDVESVPDSNNILSDVVKKHSTIDITLQSTSDSIVKIEKCNESDINSILTESSVPEGMDVASEVVVESTTNNELMNVYPENVQSSKTKMNEIDDIPTESCNGFSDSNLLLDVENELVSNIIQKKETKIMTTEETTAATEVPIASLTSYHQVSPPLTKRECESLEPIKKLKNHITSMPIDLYCYICNTNFKRTNHFRRHLNSHSVRENSNCIKCDINFTKFIELNGHMLTEHATIDRKCIPCNITFKNPLHLQHHIKALHSEKSPKTHRCNICSAAFKCITELEEHMVRHYKREYICCICNVAFPSQALVKEHLAIHSLDKVDQLAQPNGDRTYECYICRVDQRSYRALANHLQDHTRCNQSFSCELCLRSFRKRIKLEDHMVQHAEGNIPNCNRCDNTQKQPDVPDDRLTRKMRRHDDKQYVCDRCKDVFETDAERRRHQLSHINEILYECDICQQTYRRKNKLRIHQQTKHGYKFTSKTSEANSSSQFVTIKTDKSDASKLDHFSDGNYLQ